MPTPESRPNTVHNLDSSKPPFVHSLLLPSQSSGIPDICLLLRSFLTLLHLPKYSAPTIRPAMDSKERSLHTSTSPDIRVPSAEQKTSIPMSLVSLPVDIRKNIYRRVLVIAHPLFLFQDTGSQAVETFAPEIPFQWLTLLYTNRKVHNEASTVLYGLNQFTFMDTTKHQGGLIQSFLNRIGSVNAGHLSHLCINFPVTNSVDGQPGKFVLKEDDLYSLKLLQEKCTNLKTLETLIYSRNSERLIDPSHDDLQFIQEAFSQIDSQFKAITSLNKIIVRYYDGTPTPTVMELMKGLGWVILRGR